MNRLISLAFLSISLTGCGADVVSTDLKQGKQLEDQVQSRLDAAMKTEQERMQQAEEAANR